MVALPTIGGRPGVVPVGGKDETASVARNTVALTEDVVRTGCPGRK